MNLELLKQNLPEYAKDIRLNLATVLSETGAQELNQKQILHIALASALATRNADIITVFLSHVKEQLTEAEINATKAATTIMAMNNVYYRFIHAMQDQTYSNLSAKLRMNVLSNPGTDHISFELSSLAVSAINGCGKCMNAHSNQLVKAGVSKIAIQSAVRIASVINAASIAIEIR